MTKKNNMTVYANEYAVLEKTEKLLLASSLDSNTLRKELAVLKDEYEKLLKKVVKVTTVSDGYQKKLMDAKEKISRQNKELEKALLEIKTLSGLLPICAGCKKIRDDDGYWSQIEEYIATHSDAQFTHGLCPACTHKLYGEYLQGDDDE